jgi:hypothetical protein
MIKRAFIIHGWGGYPDEGWLYWLKQELEKNGFEVYSPAMPNTLNPIIKEWVSSLSALVGNPTKNDYFIGLSLGCQAIMRYLEKLPKDDKVKAAFFMAGFVNLMNLSDGERDILKEWLETPIDLNKAKTRCNKFVSIFSDNDPIVPLSDKNIFEKQLDAKIIIEKGKGHFDSEIAVPYLLKEILNT